MPSKSRRKSQVLTGSYIRIARQLVGSEAGFNTELTTQAGLSSWPGAFGQNSLHPIGAIRSPIRPAWQETEQDSEMMAEQQVKAMITALEVDKNDVYTNYDEAKYGALVAKYQKDNDCDRRGIRTPSVPILCEFLAQKHHLRCDQKAWRSSDDPSLRRLRDPPFWQPAHGGGRENHARLRGHCLRDEQAS